MNRLVTLLSSAALCGVTHAQQTWYVDKYSPGPAHDGLSWRTAFVELQDALLPDNLSLNPGDEIWVAAATYFPMHRYRVDGATAGSRDETFLIPNNVSIYGGFNGVINALDPNDMGELYLTQRDEVANETILSGELGNPADPNDNAYHVVTAHNIRDEKTKVSGFTIRDGQANGRPTEASVDYDRLGGGILIVGTNDGESDVQSSLRVTRCILDHNESSYRGGGIAVLWSDVPSDPNDVRPARIVNCRFESNGATYSDPNTPPTGKGGGIGVVGAAFEVTNCVFFTNNCSERGAGQVALSSCENLAGATVL